MSIIMQIVACSIAILILSFAAYAATSSTDSYPEKSVRFIVPFPPAALNDFLGRLLSARLSETWKRQVVVDNRAGGNTIIRATKQILGGALPCLRARQEH